MKNANKIGKTKKNMSEWRIRSTFEIAQKQHTQG